MKKIMRLSSLIIMQLALSTFIYAQHHDDGHEAETHQESHEHHHAKHHLALFNGATTNFNHESTAYSIGLDYEYRLSDLVGTGFVGELVLAESTEIILGVPIFVHPVEGLKFLLAPLLVFAEDHHEAVDPHHSVEHDTGKEASAACRIGIAYDFHFDKISVGPSVTYDIGKTQAAVYGFALGFGF